MLDEADFLARLEEWRSVPREEQARRAAAQFAPLPWPARVASLVATMTRQLLAGNPMSSEAERERRASACDACEKHDPEKDACNHCGCGVVGIFATVGLTLEMKRSLALAECPRGRWRRERHRGRFGWLSRILKLDA